jgi:hypothetical protein
MEVISKGYNIRRMIAGTGGGVKGDLAVVSSATAVKAAAAPSAATVLGIFLETVDAAAEAKIAVPEPGALIRSHYVGSTKTSLADADIGKVFDLSDENDVNLDDTTGGICVCQGYDNSNSTIDFVIPRAAMYW